MATFETGLLLVWNLNWLEGLGMFEAFGEGRRDMKRVLILLVRTT